MILSKGDAIERLTEFIHGGIKVDLVLIDPPYEHENHGGGLTRMGNSYNTVKQNIDFMCDGFDLGVLDLCEQLCRVPNILVFCSNKQIGKLLNWFEHRGLNTTLLAWQKTNPCPVCNGKYISDLEFIIYARRQNAPWNNDADIKTKYKLKSYPFVANKIHPAQKPVELLRDLISLHSLPNQTVLDCYMGSGSTGVACAELGRDFIGVEIDDKYFDIAKERLSLPMVRELF